MSGELPIRIERQCIIVSKTGATFAKDTTKEQWLDIGSQLSTGTDAIKYILGDWYLKGIAQQWDQSELPFSDADLSLIKEYAFTCEKVKERRESLTFGHHQAVAAHTEDHDIQLELLDMAEQKGMTVPELRRYLADKAETRKEAAKAGRFTPDGWLADFRGWKIQQDFSRWPKENRDMLKSKLEKVREEIEETIEAL